MWKAVSQRSLYFLYVRLFCSRKLPSKAYYLKVKLYLTRSNYLTSIFENITTKNYFICSVMYFVPRSCILQILTQHVLHKCYFLRRTKLISSFYILTAIWVPCGQLWTILQGTASANLMLLTVFYLFDLFDLKVSGSLVTRLGP